MDDFDKGGHRGTIQEHLHDWKCRKEHVGDEGGGSGAMRQSLVLPGVLLLTGCGVPSNPEKEPVVLLCAGEQIVHAANGEVAREHKREFYRIDGVEHTLQTWDDKTQSFGIGSMGLVVSPTEVRYSRDDSIIAGIVSTKTITFDRVSGRVTDEFAMSNGGTITFAAACKPVKSPTSEKTF